MNETPQPAFENAYEEDEGINFLDLMQTLAENARLLFYGPILAGLIALGISFAFKPSYVAQTSIITPQPGGSAAAALAQLGSLAGLASAATGLKSPTEMYVGLLKSRTVADRLIDRFEIMKAKGIKTRADARKLLARISGITFGKDGLIHIGVVSRVPKLSADLANAYVEELRNLSMQIAVTEAQRRRMYYEKELAKAKDHLTQAEVALGSSGIDESALKFNPASMGQGIAMLMSQIAAKEVQLSSMRGYLTENSPDYRQAQKELAALRAQVQKFERPRANGNADYINRFREFKYREALFEQLAKQYEIAKLDEASEGIAIQVVDVAVPPDKKSNWSKAMVALIGWLTGGLLLLIFVFVRRVLRNAKQDSESAAKLAAIGAGFKRLFVPWRAA
jgi:uncharacterized protein involved in exopolysaccharide biosynthesis